MDCTTALRNIKFMPLRILFVQPSLLEVRSNPQLILKGYLSLGTLISALKDMSFLRKFAIRTGKRYLLPLINEHSILVELLILYFPLKTIQIHEILLNFFQKKGFIPHIICITATSTQVEEVCQVVDVAKKLLTDVLCIIGGPHVTVLPKDFLENSNFDVVCVGEGVETLVDLCLSYIESGFLGIKDIKGIAFKDEEGNIHLNSPRSFLFSLDEYPYPSNSIGLFLKEIGKSEKVINEPIFILAGFGCPRRCIFCAQYSIHLHGAREKSAESLFEEIKTLYYKGFRRFALVQETFLQNKNRLDRFCQLLNNSGFLVEWTIEAHPSEVSYQLLLQMKEAGLRFIQVGVESGDQKLLDRLGKKINLDQVINLKNWCRILNIHTTFYFLVGLPNQDWPSILRSALFIKKNYPFNKFTYHIPVSVAIPYPGTQIAKEGLVRLVNNDISCIKNLPNRNPEFREEPEGFYNGQSNTETDVMTSEDIFESYIFLDDFGFFLMQAKFNSGLNIEEMIKAKEFAMRNFYAIQRRTIRDLIIRASPGLTPDKYRQNRKEILKIDGNAERRLIDLVPHGEEESETLNFFLTSVRFIKGFHVMKKLNVINRIKWMIICAIIWKLKNYIIKYIDFEKDSEEEGNMIERKLKLLPIEELLYLLDLKKQDSLLTSKIVVMDENIRMWDFRFLYQSKDYILLIKSICKDEYNMNNGETSFIK